MTTRLTQLRSKILTTCMAVAVISGSMYGASLKTQQQAKQQREQQNLASPPQQEALDDAEVLRAAREGLVYKRNRLEKQIHDVQRRQEKRRQDTESE